MPTVLIVDDHPAFRRSIRSLLEEDGLVVVGEATTGREALALAELLRPEIVLLDIGLPDMDGMDVAQDLAGGTADAAVVLTSSRDADAYGDRLTGAAAAGFLPKDKISGQAVLQLVAR